MSARLGWVIVYMPDVEAAVALYGRAVSYVRDPWGTLVEVCSPVVAPE